jgi:hypothetical protein
LADRGGLSRELQIGKAAEHLVCAELILLGHGAFLADAGHPYDVVADVRGALLRVQVKSTQRPYRYERSDGRTVSAYRFGLRKGRHYARADRNAADVYAFVGLDIRRVAYLHVSELVQASGLLAGIVEFGDEADARRWGTRTFQKCSSFPESGAPADTGLKRCFQCDKEKPASSEYFVPNKRYRNGITGTCRDCHRVSDREAKREKRKVAA